jgi:hypothetical protein
MAMVRADTHGQRHGGPKPSRSQRPQAASLFGLAVWSMSALAYQR